MNKEDVKVICKKCGELKVSNIGRWQKGTMLYDVYVYRGHVVYEYDEFEDEFEVDYGWYCKKCGYDIDTTEEEVVALSNKEDNLPV